MLVTSTLRAGAGRLRRVDAEDDHRAARRTVSIAPSKAVGCPTASIASAPSVGRLRERDRGFRSSMCTGIAPASPLTPAATDLDRARRSPDHLGLGGPRSCRTRPGRNRAPRPPHPGRRPTAKPVEAGGQHISDEDGGLVPHRPGSSAGADRRRGHGDARPGRRAGRTEYPVAEDLSSSHSEDCPIPQNQQWPQAMLNATATRSPTRRVSTPAPTASIIRRPRAPTAPPVPSAPSRGGGGDRSHRSPTVWLDDRVIPAPRDRDRGGWRHARRPPRRTRPHQGSSGKVVSTCPAM